MIVISNDDVRKYSKQIDDLLTAYTACVFSLLSDETMSDNWMRYFGVSRLARGWKCIGSGMMRTTMRYRKAPFVVKLPVSQMMIYRQLNMSEASIYRRMPKDLRRYFPYTRTIDRTLGVTVQEYIDSNNSYDRPDWTYDFIEWSDLNDAPIAEQWNLQRVMEELDIAGSCYSVDQHSENTFWDGTMIKIIDFPNYDLHRKILDMYDE